jgi:hypothetical protein
MSYQVLQPNERFQGLAYTDLFRDSMRWLVSLDPDSNNNGPVVYLRGIDFAQTNGDYALFTRVGKNKFTISDNQAIFLPIITYYIDSYHRPRSDNEQKRLIELNRIMNYGFVPNPDNVLINGKPPDDPKKFRIISSDFDLVVPNSSYGDQTLAPLLDEPFNEPIPDGCKCRVGGYAYLIHELEAGDYTIVSAGQGELGYNTALAVEITVREGSQGRGVGQDGGSTINQTQGRSLKSRLAEQKKIDSDIELDKLNRYIDKCFGIAQA